MKAKKRRGPVTRAAAEDAVRTLLRWSGDDPNREGLLDTPKRVVDAYGDWFSGYATHQCMTIRGVHKGRVSMVTSKMLGAFRDDARTRAEFLRFIDIEGRA